MADEALTNEQVAEMRKKRTFRKFTFRGVDLDKLLDLSMEVGGWTEPRRAEPSHAAAVRFLVCVVYWWHLMGA